jgi:hypothetical protein
MNDLLDLKEDFTRRGVLIAFNGAFSHSLIEELGNAAKAYLESERMTPQKIIDVFAVYIEQTQNVRNYSKLRQLHERGRETAIITIGCADSEYTVSAGNYVLRQDVVALNRKLDDLVGLDKAELRKRYKEQLRRDAPPGATGAGVGLIDMARRATSELIYQFDAVDDEFAFFTLQVTVAGEQ